MKLSDQEQTVVRAIQYAAESAGYGGGLASVSDVIKALSWPKVKTKRLLVQLADKGIVAIHRHDYPSSVSRTDRKRWLRLLNRAERKYDYYHVVSLRNPYYTILGTRKTVTKDLDLAILKADTQKAALAKGKSIYAGKGYTNMKAKKKANPSPAQLRARRAFVKMAKERSRLAKRKRNSSATRSLKKAGSSLKRAVKSTLDAGSKLLGAGAKAINPHKRIKVRNSYIDLVIKGQAKKTPQGWKVGRKTIPQGRGTTKVASSYYLDRHTGFVYAKRQRNVAMGFRDGSGVFHPIRASSDYDEGRVGHTTRRKAAKASSRKAGSTARHKAGVKTKKATTSRLAGRSLQKSSGLLKKRRKNVQMGYYDSFGFHPIRASKDYNEDRVGHGTRKKAGKASKTKAASTHRHKSKVASRRATTSRLAGRSLKKSSGLLKRKRRNPDISSSEIRNLPDKQRIKIEAYKLRVGLRGDSARVHLNADKSVSIYVNGVKKMDVSRAGKVSYSNPSPKSIRRKFAGRVGAGKDLYFPKAAPRTGMAKLGKLTLIKTKRGTIKPTHRNPSGEVWLCSDTNGRLWLGSTKDVDLFSGPAQSFGEVSRLEYEESKPHLGYGPTVWFHKMGEESGKRPTLHSDGEGGLVFKGGAYKIKREGIVD